MPVVVVVQDLAIIESMGASIDRSKEHLVASDAMLVRTRRALLSAARGFADIGATRPVLDEPFMEFRAASVASAYGKSK